MKKSFYLLVLAVLMPFLGHAADTVDAEGYPIVYLQGTINGWSVNDNYRFSRSGEVYTLHLNALTDDFKIADANWDSFDYGMAPNGGSITDDCTMELVYGGANIPAIDLQDVTLKFRYAPATQNITVLAVGCNGNVPEDPTFGEGGDEGGDDPVEKCMVYFQNDGGWELPHVWVWSGYNVYTENSSWPGDPMTYVSDNLWSYEVTKVAQYGSDPQYIIFTDGNGTQTDNLTFERDKTYKWSDYQKFPDVLTEYTRPEVQPTGTLPVLYINVYYTDAEGNFLTDAEGNKRFNYDVIDYNLADKDYRSGEYWLDLKDCGWMDGAKSIGSAEEPLPLEIKARGNWTRIGFSKKPFKLKLGSKQNMLNINRKGQKSKHWAILAHADDNFGYMRNFVGFNIGNRLELPWTPNVQPIEVVMNGDYRGIYFLTESIRIEKGRVDITELKDNIEDRNLLSGGYLVELDNYYQEENQVHIPESNTSSMLWVTADTPEEYSESQMRFVTEQFTEMDTRVGSHDADLWSYLDLDDAARYYLANEIISHTEAYHGSTYLYRNHGEGQKWHFTPLWDCGNAFNGPTNGFFYNNTFFWPAWIGHMTQVPGFYDKVSETWKWFMANNFDGLYDEIDSYADHIAAAAVRDHERWVNTLVPANGTNVYDNSDMNSRKEAVKNHLAAKIQFMRDYFGDYSGQHDEPLRDATPAAPLPDWASPVTMGDTNGDGMIDATDIAYLIDQMLGLSHESFEPAAADLNGDGTVDSVDIAALISLILGI